MGRLVFSNNGDNWTYHRFDGRKFEFRLKDVYDNEEMLVQSRFEENAVRKRRLNKIMKFNSCHDAQLYFDGIKDIIICVM